MIHIKNLSFGYKQSEQLFKELNLSLPPGYIYGLLGRNGAGKSSLLKIIAGLVFPDQGSLDIDGFIPKDRLPLFLQEVFLVMEEFLLPDMKTGQFVDLYSPFYPRFNNSLFKEYLKEFNLDTDRNLRSLSYGQKKKFLLSFGLATDCKLLILDEPTNGLDTPSKSQFRKIIANAIHEERTFIISTHQIRDMENLIDPVIIIDEGQLVFFQDYESIAEKLSFLKQADINDTSNIVYYEPSLGGFTVIKRNTSQQETRINLEVLFNAVISNQSKIKEVFNS